MSTNEKKFRKAARAYAERNNAINFHFYAKENDAGNKEVVAPIHTREEWTQLFKFDGIDTVSIKKRLSEAWGDMITLEAFCIAYG